MKFGPIPTAEAEGAILAHSTQLPGGALKKGRVLTAADIGRLADHGIKQIIAARLEPGDVTEDIAATRIARAIVGDAIEVAAAFTGRVNVFARQDGLARIDRDALVAINRIDEGLTVATLPPFARVTAGQMVATVKIIPFALPEDIIAAAEAMIAGVAQTLISVAAFQPQTAALILTELPGSKPSVMAKRQQAMAHRLESCGSTIETTETVPHDMAAVRDALTRACDRDPGLFLVFGASAIVDRHDVIPAAIEAAGGEIRQFGMPVDPGNLLLLGRLAGRPVIGVPSCASSPKINGLDWVLERTLAGLDVTRDDFAEMAVGGLLMEIASRPQPREATNAPSKRRSPRIAAIVLAAGRSTRMGARNKLLETLGGTPMVRHAVEAAIGSRATETIVVTGHQAEAVREAVDRPDISFVHNADFATGLASSLRAGLEAVPDDADGAIVLLGDMPGVTSAVVDQLIAAFAPDDGRGICMPTFHGRRGNPVLWARRYFEEMRAIDGDTGARGLLAKHAAEIAEVPIETGAIHLDIDTPEALAEARREAK